MTPAFPWPHSKRGASGQPLPGPQWALSTKQGGAAELPGEAGGAEALHKRQRGCSARAAVRGAQRESPTHRSPWTEEPGGLQPTGSQEPDTTEETQHTSTRRSPLRCPQNLLVPRNRRDNRRWDPDVKPPDPQNISFILEVTHLPPTPPPPTARETTTCQSTIISHPDDSQNFLCCPLQVRTLLSTEQPA